MSYRVCIPTAGIGSRLGTYTKYLNKSLVCIANRPTLSHLIELFPDDAEFVIALGHKGHLVREFIRLAYPDREFIFSEVSPFDGPGSGLGLSLLSCKDHLQEPFVFISCDTLIKGKVPPPDYNWMGFDEVEDHSSYRTIRLADGQVIEICEKGAEGSGLRAYIGLAGIYDYKSFWKTMEHGGDDAVITGEVHGLRSLTEKIIKAYRFNWFDTGNISALENTRQAFKEANSPNILDKANEAIWFVKEHVIKFSDDTEFIANRIERVKHIAEYIPVVVDSTSHMYMYRKVHGEIMSEAVSIPLFVHLLETCKSFWERHVLSNEEEKTFKQICDNFYRIKTEERIALFYRSYNRQDGTELINNEPMPRLAELLESIDWKWMSKGLPGRFHGDFHFENILWSSHERRFVFLDWRQDFGGNLTTGDIYYDLAKLMHGLIICHELIAAGQYNVAWSKGEIRYDFFRKQVLVECERVFENWLAGEGLDVKKTRVLTALIYLNIAGLHHYPYCLLLYALGKRMLKEELGRN